MAFKKQNEANKPAHTIRCGVLSASIWEQNGKNGTFYRVNVQRAYKPEGAEAWEHTDSFGKDDLLTVAKLLDLSHSWIMRAEAEARKER
jgi:hypothetical protein